MLSKRELICMLTTLCYVVGRTHVYQTCNTDQRCKADTAHSSRPTSTSCRQQLPVFELQMVYSAASASDTMSVKAEASFSGWGCDVSAEFSKTESTSSQSSGIYFDYYTKKIFNPDPSNLKEFGECVRHQAGSRISELPM